MLQAVTTEAGMFALRERRVHVTQVCIYALMLAVDRQSRNLIGNSFGVRFQPALLVTSHGRVASVWQPTVRRDHSKLVSTGKNFKGAGERGQKILKKTVWT